jgi:hypothetical protein
MIYYVCNQEKGIENMKHVIFNNIITFCLKHCHLSRKNLTIILSKEYSETIEEMLNEGVEAGSDEYMDGLELLQYDLLYGDRYAYGGVDLYPASDLVMGVKDITISGAYLYNGKLHIYGDNFTKWSRVYINGEKVSTTYESGQVLTIDADDIENGDTIVVNQLGSSNTIFRSSNEYTFYDPNYEEGEDAETTDDDSEPTYEKNE